MAINLVPVLIGGGVFVYASRKSKNRRRKARSKAKAKKAEEKKALPPAEEKATPDNGYGEIYAAREVDFVEARVGENFTLTLGENPSTGHLWELTASPPDNSVEALGSDYVQDPSEPGMTGVGGTKMYKFKASKPGSGSLVFHHQAPWLKGKEPPAEIVEVETKIS